jgi:hypothetical protein
MVDEEFDGLGRLFRGDGREDGNGFELDRIVEWD